MSADSGDTTERPVSAKSLTAAYIEDLIRELETLSVREKIEPLSDLLRQAREEAQRVALTR